MTKIITIGTMGRCGSTLLTHAVLGVLKLENKSFSYVEAGDEVEGNFKLDYLTEKVCDYVEIISHHNAIIHGPNSDYVFTCVRDLREIIASTKKFIGTFPEGSIKDECNLHMRLLNSWAPYETFRFKYEDYINDVPKYYDTIISQLQISNSKKYSELELIIESLISEIPTHITSKEINSNKEYPLVLTEFEIQEIDDNFKEYFIDNNYI